MSMAIERAPGDARLRDRRPAASEPATWPRLLQGTELIGRVAGSGLREPPYLVRRCVRPGRAALALRLRDRRPHGWARARRGRRCRRRAAGCAHHARAARLCRRAQACPVCAWSPTAMEARRAWNVATRCWRSGSAPRAGGHPPPGARTGPVRPAAPLAGLPRVRACSRVPLRGARPGRIGIGIYLVWPVFYTDVTDSWHLSETGRLRSDLGGVYFNVPSTRSTVFP